MEDTRNFRSIYYEKVGCRSVEEKKSLEILLKENPVNLPKLKQFLKLFSVPSIQRSLLYSLALGVYPIYMESKECVMNQKKDIYNDLNRALEVMRYIDEKTPKNRVFYAMWLLETRALGNGVNIHRDATTFPLIAQVIIESLDVGTVESYFLARNFYKFSEEIANDLPKLKALTAQTLEKEDNDLYNNLKSKNILDELPFDRWYPSIFASILNELALIRIFDRIVGGWHQIVIFIFIVICSYTRYNLKTQLTASGVVKIIENYPGDDSEKSDVIVNKSIELWHKFCSIKSSK